MKRSTFFLCVPFIIPFEQVEFCCFSRCFFPLGDCFFVQYWLTENHLFRHLNWYKYILHAQWKTQVVCKSTTKQYHSYYCAKGLLFHTPRRESVHAHRFKTFLDNARPPISTDRMLFFVQSYRRVCTCVATFCRTRTYFTRRAKMNTKNKKKRKNK